jgi:hypothetical protein
MKYQQDIKLFPRNSSIDWRPRFMKRMSLVRIPPPPFVWTCQKKKKKKQDIKLMRQPLWLN